MRNTTLILAVLILLAGCGVRLPGSMNARTTPSPAAVAPASDAPLALRTVAVEPGLRGAILRVEAVAPTQGWHDAALVPLEAPAPEGVLAFELRATPPAALRDIGRERSRLLTAATFLETAVLRDLRQVSVNGTAIPLAPTGSR